MSEIAFRCLDCQLSPNSIFWYDWFWKSDHEGHDVQDTETTGGFWDWGDPTAWKPSGFCSDHQGYKEKTDEEIINLLPEGVGERHKMVIEYLGEYLHDKLAALKDPKLENSDRMEYENQILYSIESIRELSQKSPAYIHFLTKMMMNIYPSGRKVKYEWPQIVYVDQEHQRVCEERIAKDDPNTVDEEGYHPCTTNLIKLILDYRNDEFVRIFSENVVYDMYASTKFKDLLGLIYVRNMREYLYDATFNNKYYFMISQTYTCPELSRKIMKDKSMSKTFNW